MIFIKNIFKICFVIIGTIIGAGFASGKEILSFFCIYGFSGFLGLIISNLVIGIIVFATFYFVYNNNINSYLDFIKTLVGNNSFLSYCISNIMNIFLLVSFIVMVSGFGAFFSQEFNLSSIFGAIIICILAFIAFFKNIDGIIKISSLLIPFLITLIVLLGLKSNVFSFNYNALISSHDINWLIKSILYASYNSIILIPIITAMKNYINNKKQIELISFFTTCIMIIMSVILYIVLCMNISKVNSVDIPIVYIANSFRYNF